LRRIHLFLPALPLLFGCSEKMKPRIDFAPPKYVEELPAQEEDLGEPSQGSLYGRGKVPLFSDRKAMNVNDIITVRISETASASSTTQRNLAKVNEGKLGGGFFTGTAVESLNDYTNISLENTSESAYTGTGSAIRNEQFQTTITARVIKILNNGNYFINGSREILVNGEKQVVKISGVISPYNITAGNEIDSQYISDAKIEYITQGELDQGTKRGWLSRFFDAIWPF
jgi:flagellar L-ring protein precursor FlgH